MRTSLLALVGLPVLVLGTAITTAVAVVGTAEFPSPTPTLGKSIGDRAGRAGTAGTVAQPGDGSRPGASTESGDDTEINGRRPHLTVIDGRAAVAPPGAIPAALSILPPPSIGLPPLTDLGGDLVWPTGGSNPRGQNSPGAGELNPGATDVRWTDPSAAEPDSLPPGKTGAGSPLSVVPVVPPQTDGDGAAEPGAGSPPPPAAGRPGRPPSDTIDVPIPSVTVGLPGQDTGRPPGADLLAPDEVVPDAVAPDLLALDLRALDEVAPEETVVPDVELADGDESQPSIV